MNTRLPPNDKFPRIRHLPWSPGVSKDDLVGDSFFFLDSPIACTISEKMDGSNVALTRDAVFARTHAHPPTHSSFNALKALHASIRHCIPEGFTVFAEWCWAVHSLVYEKLPNPPLFLIGVRSEVASWSSQLEPGTWLDVPRCKELAEQIGIPHVPIIWQGSLIAPRGTMDGIERVLKYPPAYGPEREGFVIRYSGTIRDADWDKLVAKWVRAGHVTTDEHWTVNAVKRQRTG
jgi:hypothetical protein